MNPFYFGTSDRRLFGIYEPAIPGGTGKRAAVLCYPWGSEYLHAHRAMRQLAIRLATAGFHTLRFDFYGTGDSAGDMTDASLALWQEDVRIALDEIREMVGTNSATLIGLRLGATVAAAVASGLPGEIEALVLWDPIVSGQDYLRQLGIAADSGDNVTNSSESEVGPATQVQGFLLTAGLIRDIKALELADILACAAAPTLLLMTQEGAPEFVPPPTQGEGGAAVTVERAPDASPWIEDTASTGIVPVAVIQRIVSWLE
jgi:exosortase A-associated hydrolase 2